MHKVRPVKCETCQLPLTDQEQDMFDDLCTACWGYRTFVSQDKLRRHGLVFHLDWVDADTIRLTLQD